MKTCLSPASELEVKQTNERDTRAVLNFVAPLGPVSQAASSPYLMRREDGIISGFFLQSSFSSLQFVEQITAICDPEQALPFYPFIPSVAHTSSPRTDDSGYVIVKQLPGGFRGINTACWELQAASSSWCLKEPLKYVNK